MGFSRGGEFDDVLNDGYVSTRTNIGNSSEVEAKVGASALDGRETLTITNVGSKTVYFGPSGFSSSDTTDGDPLFKKQSVTIQVGPNVGVFLRCDGSDDTDVVIQEWA